MTLASRIITVTLNPAVDRVMQLRRLVPGEHPAVREVSRTPGGKGVNVSRVLARLGVPSIATGFLGDGNRHEFEALFASGSVADRFITLPGRTRENLTIAETEVARETHLRDRGLDPPAEAVGELAGRLACLTRKQCIVVFSGSLPPGLAPEALVELIGVCRNAGTRVAVDTSGPALSAAAKQALWMVKPNVTELSRLAGHELKSLAEQAAAARGLTRLVENVLLSRGAEGAVLFAGDAATVARVTVAPDEVRNTVGCGDVLLGAFLSAHSSGRQPSEALRLAVAAAAAAACSPVAADWDTGLAEELASRAQVAPLASADEAEAPR